MSLKSLLKTTLKIDKTSKVLEIDKDKIRENLESYQDIIAYWRKYPDKFIDYLCSMNPDNTFHFYYFQRIYLILLFHLYKYDLHILQRYSFL